MVTSNLGVHQELIVEHKIHGILLLVLKCMLVRMVILIIVTSLTLGDDYLIYFCVVVGSSPASGLMNVTSSVEFGPTSVNSKYRSGWLDGQNNILIITT